MFHGTGPANKKTFSREREIGLYIDNIYQYESDSRLEQLRLKQHEDEILLKVTKLVENGWPGYLSIEDVLLKPYFERRSLLTKEK